MEPNTLFCGDILAGLATLATNQIDLVITSPPYGDLRSYENTLELNWNFEIFTQVVAELSRVVKPGGVVVWVVGDQTIRGSESGSSFKQALHFLDAGFLLHDTMIYEKNGASFPASPRRSRRYSQIFEYMFIFSNQCPPRTVNLLCDKKNRWAGSNTFGTSSRRLRNGKIKAARKYRIAEFGVRNNIWRYNTGKGYSSADTIASLHPAIFPDALARDHLRSWSNPGDHILDPLAGSGTTLKQAQLLGRYWYGIEAVPEYQTLIQKRLAEVEFGIDLTIPARPPVQSC